MARRPIRPRKDCPSFRPGHTTHWIQARLAFRERDQWRPVADVAVAEDGVLTVTPEEGEVERLWHHHPAYVRDVLDQPIAHVWRSPEALLLVRPVDRPGTPCVSVCPADEARPCPVDEDPRDLSLGERIDRFGGFAVPGREALRRFREQDET